MSLCNFWCLWAPSCPAACASCSHSCSSLQPNPYPLIPCWGCFPRDPWQHLKYSSVHSRSKLIFNLGNFSSWKNFMSNFHPFPILCGCVLWILCWFLSAWVLMFFPHSSQIHTINLTQFSLITFKCCICVCGCVKDIPLHFSVVYEHPHLYLKNCKFC